MVFVRVRVRVTFSFWWEGGGHYMISLLFLVLWSLSWPFLGVVVLVLAFSWCLVLCEIVGGSRINDIVINII